MINELLKLNKISYQQYQNYMLFQSSEMGREWLAQAKQRVMMGIPPDISISAIILAKAHGYADFVREIMFDIEVVNNLIKELENDRNKE